MTLRATLLFSVLLQLGCSTPPHAKPLSAMTIMAHRGLYQTYPRETITPQTCTAEIIHPPSHDLLENTIPSMAKAFELNADMIELDIHSTSDGKIVVFHDWTLECRTNGQGVTQEQTFDDLRSLDIGYGYTADNHASHPFRCVIGSPEYAKCMKRNQMPTLREVLEAFPTKRFVINMKSRSPSTLMALVNELQSVVQDLNYNLRNLSFYCNDASINEQMRNLLPEIEVPNLTMREMKACFDTYLSTGNFTPQCQNAHLGVSIEDLRQLGKTGVERLVGDLHTANGILVVLRVDTASDARYLEEFDVDMFWTDRIDIVGPLVKYDRVDADLRSYDAKVASMRREFATDPSEPTNKSWVKVKLAHMYEVDQYMRNYVSVIHDHRYSPKEERYFLREFHLRFREVDGANTKDLKELLKIYGWIKISEFDTKSDQVAWLLVQHADEDPAFQNEVLGILSQLYKSGDTSPSNYAYLVDRVAASWSDPSRQKLQRYGTQGKCVAPGRWEPIPIEDPGHLDERRKEVGLGPFKDYIDVFKTICK